MPYARLCTIDDVEAILSAEGVVARGDDSQDGTVSASETKLLNDQISRGSREIAMRLNMLYKVTEFQGSNPPVDTPATVRDMAAVLSAYWMCLRRNNPPTIWLQTARQEVFDTLELVKHGNLRLPDITTALEHSPFVTNFHLDGRFRSAKARRVDATSTGALPPGQLQSHPEYNVIPNPWE